MGSTFGGYNIAYSGMFVNHTNLAVTSANLSNVNTTGYSRVRAANAETNTLLPGSVSVGNGSSVEEIRRARNQFLDQTYRRQNAESGYWAVKSGDLEYMQEVLMEFVTNDDDGTSDDGLQQVIEDFFYSWEELSKDPSSISTRQSVTEAGVSLISALTGIDEQLQQLQQDAVNRVKDSVASLNDLAEQVAVLNKEIARAEAGGGEASYLRDQRDSLLDEMSSLANIRVSVQSNGVFQVTIEGVTLVSGDRAYELVTEGDGTSANPLTVRWADFDCTAAINSGSIKAYLEDADPTGYETIDAAGLPYDFTADAASSITNLRQGLNDLITTLAIQINAVHSTGIGLDGSTGLDFFTTVDASQPLSIGNIQVNPDLVDDWNLIAASASGDAGDNTIANQIYDLSSGEYFQYDASLMNCNDFYQALISWLGTAGDNAESYYETQTALVQQLDTQRQSVASVSMDEEMSNMIMYQNAYSASSRVLSTIDGLIGDLIDEIG